MSAALEVVAAAARTPVGLTARSSAAAVHAGISRLRDVAFTSATGAPYVLGTDPLLSDTVWGLDRMREMLAFVVEQVVNDLGDALAGLRYGCDVSLVLPELRPGFSGEDAETLVTAVQAQLGRGGISCRVNSTHRGHAGVLAAIHQAMQRAGTREADPVFLVIGLESHHHVDTLMWLESEQRLAMVGLPTGFKPGEAAACLVLTTRGIRQSWRRPALARVVGTGVAQESLGRDSDTGSLGVGISKAVNDAACGLSLPSEAADAVYCDLNGERYRSEEWGFFALRCHRALRSIEYLAPCDSWGDVGAAFGSLAVILAIEDFGRTRNPRARALLMAGSDGGLRSAMFLEPPA